MAKPSKKRSPAVPPRPPKAHDKQSGLGRWLLDNQINICFGLLGSLLLVHAVAPAARPHTAKLFSLSHYNAVTGRYAAGRDDVGFIAFCVVLLTGLRAACMDRVLAPLGRGLGLSRRKEVTRFAEQAWMLVVYGVFWPLGMYIYVGSPYFLNMEQLWTGWPQRELPALTKAYVLAEWAFWVQQMVALHLEERRKDHWQMLGHHVLTLALIYGSYAYHYTRVGNLILVMMDVIDIIFPLAKCFKYLGFSTVCDILFGLFAAVWLVTRHALYLAVCWSVYRDTPRVIEAGCYRGRAHDLEGPLPVPQGWSHLLAPFRDTGGLVCFDDSVRLGFVSYLLLLQVLMVIWSFFIVRVVVRVVRGEGAEDIRSDGEEEEEEEDEEKERWALEQEVGVEGLDLEGWKRRAKISKAAGASSGVSVRGHSDRKELLNRIGCDKKIGAGGKNRGTGV